MKHEPLILVIPGIYIKIISWYIFNYIYMCVLTKEWKMLMDWGFPIPGKDMFDLAIIDMKQWQSPTSKEVAEVAEVPWQACFTPPLRQPLMSLTLDLRQPQRTMGWKVCPRPIELPELLAKKQFQMWTIFAIRWVDIIYTSYIYIYIYTQR